MIVITICVISSDLYDSLEWSDGIKIGRLRRIDEKRVEVTRDLVLRVMMKNMDCLSDYL